MPSRHIGATLLVPPMQTCLFKKVYVLLTPFKLARDVLARHKRLVHTKPEDREPPKKRGRPPKSSYTAEATQQQKESPIAVNPPSHTNQNTSTEQQWPAVRTDHSSSNNFEFPKLEGEPHNGSFLTNPFNDTFGFGPMDTLSEFNFAEQ